MTSLGRAVQCVTRRAPLAPTAQFKQSMFQIPLRLLSTSIGRKVLMSITGLLLVGFLIVHLLGNLTLFMDDGGATFDAYSDALVSNPLLPLAELGLLLLFAAHIALGLRVSLQNREARGEPYVARATMGQATPGSRTMLISGLLVLIFLIIHLLDFRLHGGEEVHESIAAQVIERLRGGPGALIYCLGMAALGLHLSHALRSSLQSLGLADTRCYPCLARAGRFLAAVMALGFASFPLYFF
ncbi:MAG: succinate dehydrogenase cytochrome b subunit, partial [Planctomycetota bacterium]|nr:succinate dehydrogenase cytochrome b subunit [Planctomycetota bacterium]